MNADDEEHFKKLLHAWKANTPGAFKDLIEYNYPSLVMKAKTVLRKYHKTSDWEPEELVHDIYPHLERQRNKDFANRKHLVNRAGKLMAHVINDHRKRDHSQKRGQGGKPISYSDLNTDC